MQAVQPDLEAELCGVLRRFRQAVQETTSKGGVAPFSPSEWVTVWTGNDEEEVGENGKQGV